MSIYPAWLPALAFVDRLLRFGVATLFALDVVFDAYAQMARGGSYRPMSLRLWIDVGVSLPAAEVLAWARASLGVSGSLLLLPFATARIGVALVAVALGMDLFLGWEVYWWPAYRMQFVLGTALVLISQVLMRTHVARAREAWARMEQDFHRRSRSV